MTSATPTAPTTTDSGHPLTTWTGWSIVDYIRHHLPGAFTDAQKQAREALETKNYSLCKVLAACHLNDSQIRCIGYLSSIEKVTAAGLPTLATLVAEASRAAADAQYEWALDTEGETEETARKVRQMEITQLDSLNQRIFDKALET